MVFAFFGLYTVVVVGVLLANSVAIINERFLKQCTTTHHHPHHTSTTTHRLHAPPLSPSPLRSPPSPLPCPIAALCALWWWSVGWHRPSADAPPTVQNRILTLLYGDVKLLLQMPLIWINIVVIVLLIIFG